MDLFDKLIAKIPGKQVIKPVSENEESDSDQDLAYEVVEDEDIEILEDNTQIVNDDSQSKNSEMEHQIVEDKFPDLENVSESRISGM